MATTTNSAVAIFQAKFKYKIAGKTDLPLSNIGGTLKDALAFNTLKTSRIREQGLIAGLTASALSDSEKSKASAEAKLAFSRDAARLYKPVRNDVSAKQGIRAVSYTLKELDSAVTDYMAAKAGGATTAADDARFTASTEAIVASLKSITLSLTGRLRTEGQFFNINLVQTKKYIDAITANLAAFDGPPAAPADSPETVPADESHTLDIEA